MKTEQGILVGIPKDQLELMLPIACLVRAIAKEVAKEIATEMLNEFKSALPNSKNSIEDRAMTIDELSRYSGLSKSWLYAHYKKEIPCYYKKADGKRKGRPYFKKSEFDRWFEQFRKEPVKEETPVHRDTDISGTNWVIPLKTRSFRKQNRGETTSL